MPLECGKAQNMCMCFLVLPATYPAILLEASEIIYLPVSHVKPFVYICHRIAGQVDGVG